MPGSEKSLSPDRPPSPPQWYPGESIAQFEEAIEEYIERIRHWIHHHPHHPHHHRPVSVNIAVGQIRPKGRQ